MNNEELLFIDAFIHQHFDRIVEWSIGDIKRCCRVDQNGICDNNGALVGAFILWCCAIDYFGGLFTGYSSRGGTKSRIDGFVKNYMKRYDSTKIYDLRWSLLHYYTLKHFLLQHEGSLESRKQDHLKEINGIVVFHLGWAIKDLEDAVIEYRKDLDRNNSLKLKLWKYYKKQHPIMPVVIVKDGNGIRIEEKKTNLWKNKLKNV